MTRFEVILNSGRVCIAGIDPNDQGVMNVEVSMVTNTPEGDRGTLLVHTTQIEGGDLTFGMADIGEGDEILIRVLPPGNISESQPYNYVDPEESENAKLELQRTVSLTNETERQFAGKERSCPQCKTIFTSIQNRGQCTECRLIFFASHPNGNVPW